MKIAVIGGGITGLILAERLLNQQHQVEIFEQHEIGGLAGGFALPGHATNYLEKYYHHFFTTDRSLIRLLEDHGLLTDVIWKSTLSGIFAEDRAWAFGNPIDLLRCSPVGSLWQRFMMGINMYHMKQLHDWSSLDEISCKEFFQRRRNGGAYHNFWKKMLEAKFAMFHDEVPAAFLWGRIHPRSSSRQNGHEVLGYLRGGFQRLINSIADRILGAGGSIKEYCSIRKINLGIQPEVIFADGSSFFDKVIWTANTEVLNRLVAGEVSMSKFIHRPLDMKYMNVTCLVLIMKKKLGKMYWINNIDPKISFGVAIEHTNLAPPEDYGMKHVIYVANYHLDDSIFNKLSDQEILDFHCPSLHKVFSTFSQRDISLFKVFRNSYGCPIYDLHYSTKMPNYQGHYPGIDICGMLQVYPEDRNLNHCIRNAETYLASVSE